MVIDITSSKNGWIQGTRLQLQSLTPSALNSSGSTRIPVGLARLLRWKFDMGDGRRGRLLFQTPVEFAARRGFAASRPQVLQLKVLFTVIQVGGYAESRDERVPEKLPLNSGSFCIHIKLRLNDADRGIAAESTAAIRTPLKNGKVSKKLLQGKPFEIMNTA
ncbi:hypothetical protein B0H13DRAFT_1902962 [Mycena leptocephala]|nr:hypothetical protein B0H13DRAFT_1902962 [Mycena leptocephala]